MACPVPLLRCHSSLSSSPSRFTLPHTDQNHLKKIHSNFYKNNTSKTAIKVLESLTMKKSLSPMLRKKKNRKEKKEESSQIILSVMLLFIFSLRALLKGGWGGGSVYFLLCHYQPGNTLKRMVATSCREERLQSFSVHHYKVTNMKNIQ